MKFLAGLRKSIIGKVMVAALVLGGFFAFFGASSTSADTVYFVRPHVVVRGYYGPRVAYWGPRYYVPRERIIIVHRRYWDPRFHCWRYR